MSALGEGPDHVAIQSTLQRVASKGDERSPGEIEIIAAEGRGVCTAYVDDPCLDRITVMTKNDTVAAMVAVAGMNPAGLDADAEVVVCVMAARTIASGNIFHGLGGDAPPVVDRAVGIVARRPCGVPIADLDGRTGDADGGQKNRSLHDGEQLHFFFGLGRQRNLWKSKRTLGSKKLRTEMGCGKSEHELVRALRLIPDWP